MRPEADCGSDHELIAKIRLKLKKVGKTTRPFGYELNQITYNYTLEVTNWFKGLDLIECLKNYDIVQEAGTKTIPKKKKYKKAKWLSEKALQIAVKRREAQGKGEKERHTFFEWQDTPIWMQSSKEEQGEIRKPSSVVNAKK